MKRVRRIPCACGKTKAEQSERCHQCKKEYTLKIRMNKTIKDVECGHHTSGYRFNQVRKIAKEVLIRIGRLKSCAICGFDIRVDACHIKGIATFPPETLLGVVNDPSNLVYLCPNHHAMLDKGLISL